MTTLRRRTAQLAWIAVILGAGIIVAGELAGWSWARLVSAALASAGGITLGATFGLSQPGKERLRSRLARWSLPMASILAAVMVLPALAALGLSTLGAAMQLGDGRAPAMSLVGLALAMTMLAATLAVTVVALRAIREARTLAAPRGADRAEGERA